MNELKMLSIKSDFHLSKNRQREILYFVKQYPEFKQELRALDGMHSGIIKLDSKMPDDSAFTSIIFKRAKLIEKISVIELAAKETNDILWHFIIDSVITDHSWDYYDQHFHIDCGRNTWYRLRREFLWRIDGKR
jgi:hypothetical protein